MRQSIVFEVEGACRDGDILVVKDWPNMNCQPMQKLVQKVIHHRETIVKEVEAGTPLPKENNSLWWIVAILALAMIGGTIWKRKRRRHIYHHKA